MGKKLAWLAAFTITMALMASSALAQGHYHRRDQGEYFFLPPRNFFYVFPRFYPPFRLHGGHYGHRFGRFGHFDPYGPYGYDSHPPAVPHRQDPRYADPDRPRSDGLYSVYIQSPPRSQVIRSNSSDIIFNVSPSKALVYIDGKLIGSARDFATERDRYMVLEGEHELKIDFPGYKPFQTLMHVVPNKTLHLDIELEAEEGGF